MLNSFDLYLGAFLILTGFTLSLLNLRKLVMGSNKSLQAVLISENVILTCIGIAFISRSVHEMNTKNINMENIEERIADMEVTENMDCNFLVLLKSYGPFVVSLINSFLSLIIDNYLHYRMVDDVKKQEDDNNVQELRSIHSVNNISKIFLFVNKYFSYVAIAMQWIVPILLALSMYPMEVKETRFLSKDFHHSSDFCMAMVDMANGTCYTANIGNYSLELRKFVPSYLEVYENSVYNESISPKIEYVVKNVQNIVSNWNNTSLLDVHVSSPPLWRRPKSDDDCMKVCYVDNKSLILYMFVIAVTSYFIPITISTVILTKIYLMDIKRASVKTYVSRELLYNILFWTPVVFDTFMSLLLCSYSMNGMRISIFNLVANVYQAVKNFMNTKYFNENTVEPITA